MLSFCVNIPLWKLFRWFRRPQLWATGAWQLHDNTPAHASCLVQRFFLWNIKSPRWLSPPLQPRFGNMWLLAFPKTKIIFEREEILEFWWDSGKSNGTADGNWENCVRSQGVYFEGDWGVTVPCTIFLVSSIFFSKCLYFSYYMARHLLDRPRA